MNNIFVTGTDTDVGKTRISEALIELLREQGHTVAGMKPIASGCDMTADGLRNDDAVRLIEQANADLPYDLINPYAFEPAIAPHIAARQAGVSIDLKLIKSSYQQIQQKTDVVVVEGAGGWLVPINETETMADLAKTLNLSIVLVVGIRLGCINHALLTIESIKQSGLSIVGWVANNIEINTQSAEIIDTLTQRLAVPLLAEIPYLSEHQKAKEYIDLEFMK